MPQGRRRCLFMDSKGLVCASRGDLQPHKRAFAHDLPFQRTLLEAVHAFRPTALVGVSTMPGAFTPEVIQVGGAQPAAGAHLVMLPGTAVHPAVRAA